MIQAEDFGYAQSLKRLSLSRMLSEAETLIRRPHRSLSGSRSETMVSKSENDLHLIIIQQIFSIPLW